MLIFFFTLLNPLFAQDQATLPVPTLSYLKGSEFQLLMESLIGKQYGYTKAQLAEIGGQSVAEYILYLSKIDVPLKRIIFIIGQDFQGSSFQNGYFGLAAARYLAQRKVEVDVVLLYPNDSLRSRLAMQCKSHSAKIHFDILQHLQEQLNVQMTKNILANWLSDYDLVVDAISLSSIEQPKIQILQIRLITIPSMNYSNSCNPYIVISNYQNQATFTKFQIVNDSFILFTVDIIVQKDTRIICYNKSLMGKEVMFQFWFHSGFIESNGLLVIDKYMLDRAVKDKKHKIFSPNFRVEVQTITLPN